MPKIPTAMALLLVATSLAAAHDLRGIQRHFEVQDRADADALAARARNFYIIRDTARRAADKTFEVSKHLEAQGFSGKPEIALKGIASRTAAWRDEHQLRVCFFDGTQTAWKNVMAVYSEILAYTTLS